MSVRHRIKLRLLGFKRPPFQLRYQRRRKIHQNGQVEQSALYLWPDRLRWHFFFLALILSSSVASQLSLCWPEAGLSIIFTILFLCCVVPWLTYSAIRIPVLDELWPTWPPFLSEWMQGIVQIGRRHSHSGNRKVQIRNILRDISGVIKAYLPPFVTQWDAVYWAPIGSCQETMLRAAIADMYQETGSAYESSVWHERAFARWLFYWCAPIWGGYVTLWLFLAAKVLFAWSVGKTQLMLAAWLWMLYGVMFVLRESTELVRWGRQLTDYHLRYAPAPLYKNLKSLSGVAIRQTEGRVKAVFSLIHLLGVVAYLSVITTLCD